MITIISSMVLSSSEFTELIMISLAVLYHRGILEAVTLKRNDCSFTSTTVMEPNKHPSLG